MRRQQCLAPACTLIVFLACNPVGMGQLTSHVPLEEPPIQYSETLADNRVSKLADKLEQEKTHLKQHPDLGYLPSVLEALEISPTSQTLVFSKTSLQIRHISPRNPRAIYFNDDTYLGWVRGSSLMEISTTDPKLGTAFYLLDTADKRPRLTRQVYDCLGCHATSMTLHVPGHAMRSVMANGDGRVETRHKSYLTELKSPWEQRFGGWYVTGQPGENRHLGNAFVRGDTIDLSRPSNIDRLEFEFDTRRYLSPYSDIVALMVLAHQIEMHNVLTKADFHIRRLEYEITQNHSQPLPEEQRFHLEEHARSILEPLLFCNEQRFTSPISGMEPFQATFTAKGPRDSRGRSLRDFDLQKRLFRYPCSFLIYSDAFTNLTPQLREETLEQLHGILTGNSNASAPQIHLDAEAKQDIHEILLETHTQYREIASRSK